MCGWAGSLRPQKPLREEEKKKIDNERWGPLPSWDSMDRKEHEVSRDLGGIAPEVPGKLETQAFRTGYTLKSRPHVWLGGIPETPKASEREENMKH